MNRTTELLVIGANGRMGRAILELCASGAGARVTAAVSRSGRPPGLAESISWFPTVPEALAGFSGVVVDVSGPGEAAARIDAVRAAGRPLVQGTTALDAPAMAALDRLAAERAVVIAPNLSPGIALLRRLVRTALRAEGPSWDIAVLDRHHAAKKDAPSGTARLLTREIAEEAGSRHRLTTPEAASFRIGGVIGEHAVHLAGAEEELILTHRALDRRVFARGAILAATFAAAAPPGAYGMEDVLGGAGTP